jgi:hypothetical protein
MIFVFTPEDDALDAGYRYGLRIRHSHIREVSADCPSDYHPNERHFREGLAIALEDSGPPSRAKAVSRRPGVL